MSGCASGPAALCKRRNKKSKIKKNEFIDFSKSFLVNFHFCLIVKIMIAPKRLKESLDVTIFSCKKCEKEIKSNTPLLNCIICTSSFHIDPACAPASLFAKGKFILPNWMMNSFICSKACSEMGVAANPAFIAMQKENNEIKERLAIIEDRLSHYEKDRERTICNTLDEMEERSIRKNNLIIFNVDEPSGKDPKVRQESDKCKVRAILGKIGVNEVLFNRCIRLGKYVKEPGKPRPIRVRVDCFDEKITILKKSNSLRSKGKQQIENAPPMPFITSDLTFLQRKFRKELVNELKTRLEDGEDVKIDWHSNTVIKKTF